MLLPTLIIVALVFGLLLLARVGGAQRAQIQRLARYWPEALLVGVGLWMAMRGSLWAGLALSAGAFLISQLREGRSRPRPAPPPAGRDNAGDAEARALLGLAINATPADIRAAFRAKMAAAHPDRGGGHDQAARLVAARDRLLRR
ncbi:MAG: molecular chaperone DnaJ [Terricaulis sp.]